MDNQLFQRIKDLLMQHQTIGVVVKPNPSLDDMAGGLGMYLVLKNMGKTVSIACPTDPVVGVSSLVGVQDVKKTLGGSVNVPGAGSLTGGDLTVSFPYKEGEIEKVSYDMDQATQKLNIHVKAGPLGLSFQNTDVQFLRGAQQPQMQPVAPLSSEAPSLLFTIGVTRLADIASIWNQAANPNTTIVNIDNKDTNEKYGDVVHASSKFSSISEEVADFLTLLEPQIELDKDTAQNLFDGISFATKDYTSPQTSYLAFEMAGILMKKGAQRGPKQQATAPAGQPVSQYFPPIPNSPLGQPQMVNSPMQQPVQPQPVQQPQMQQFGQPQQFQQPMQQPFVSQPQMVQQPVQQYAPMQTQPVQPMQQPVQPQPVQQPQQTQNQAPADWLTPKVYKGSSIL